MSSPFISFLSDFGARDPSAAICHGVILSIAPKARIVDVSHEVRKFSIREGAVSLWCALPYLPVGTHIAVVDPGVGTERLPIGIRVGRGDVLVGPDNGLLLAAAERLGGPVAAHELANPAYRLGRVSSSFHGRDIFAPAAAHLGLGVPLEAFGPRVDPGRLVRSPVAAPTVREGALESSVVYVDTFGNVKLAGIADDLVAAVGPLGPGRRLVVEIGADRQLAMPWASVFGAVPPGQPLLYEDSYGRICLAVNQGDAAATLGLGDDDRVVVRSGIETGRP